MGLISVDVRTVRSSILFLIGMAVVSLVAGLGINRMRSQPLPLVYLSPADRLNHQLMELVSGPVPFDGEIPAIGLSEIRADVEAHRGLILDARSSAFFEQGHVPGALNLSRDNFAADYKKLSGRLNEAKDKQVVVYCSGGACHDSKLVANALVTLGFSDVKIFTGGWEAWAEANLPQERS
jgi:rhodanese-related sulfurtransferase